MEEGYQVDSVNDRSNELQDALEAYVWNGAQQMLATVPEEDVPESSSVRFLGRVRNWG